jgi:hypothetical protein
MNADKKKFLPLETGGRLENRLNDKKGCECDGIRRIPPVFLIGLAFWVFRTLPVGKTRTRESVNFGWKLSGICAFS